MSPSQVAIPPIWPSGAAVAHTPQVHIRAKTSRCPVWGVAVPEAPHLVRPVSGSTTLRMTLCRASHSSLVMGFIAWMRDFCSSVRTGREDGRRC
jgi:hypothetical protein